VCVEQYF